MQNIAVSKILSVKELLDLSKSKISQSNKIEHAKKFNKEVFNIFDEVLNNTFIICNVPMKDHIPVSSDDQYYVVTQVVNGLDSVMIDGIGGDLLKIKGISRDCIYFVMDHVQLNPLLYTGTRVVICLTTKEEHRERYRVEVDEALLLIENYFRACRKSDVSKNFLQERRTSTDFDAFKIDGQYASLACSLSSRCRYVFCTKEKMNEFFQKSQAQRNLLKLPITGKLDIMGEDKAFTDDARGAFAIQRLDPCQEDVKILFMDAALAVHNRFVEENAKGICRESRRYITPETAFSSI